MYDCLHCQVNHKLQRQIYLFLSIFLQLFVFFKVKSLVHLQVQQRVTPQVHLELFCELFCTNKSTTMCLFKCNSVVTSIVPLISTLNVGVLSDEPSGAPSTVLTCSDLSQIKHQVHTLCHFFVHPLVAFTENSKAPIQI